MARFELEWTMQGRCVVEADDADEAESILSDGLLNLDHSMFDEIDVEEVISDSVEEMKDDD